MDLQKLISLIDLTLLDKHAQEADILALCEKAVTPFGHVAAVCVYPEWVALAKKQLASHDVMVATVCNFPKGNQPLNVTEEEIRQCVKAGADEIDFVVPYENLLSWNVCKVLSAMKYVKHCIKLIRSLGKKSKVIVEFGAFEHRSRYLARLSCRFLKWHPDFIKTSTGFYPEKMTFDTFAGVVKNFDKTTGGLKISGGMATMEIVEPYIELLVKILGETWLSPNNFRIGSSQLLDHLVKGLPKNKSHEC